MKAWVYFPIMAILLSGCASGMISPPGISGRLYSHTTVPYTPDLNNTRVTDITGTGLGIRVKEPFSGYGVSAEVDANAVGEIARKHGLTEVYFADMEEIRIFTVWRARKLHIYGR